MGLLSTVCKKKYLVILLVFGTLFLTSFFSGKALAWPSSQTCANTSYGTCPNAGSLGYGYFTKTAVNSSSFNNGSYQSPVNGVYPLESTSFPYMDTTGPHPNPLPPNNPSITSTSDADVYFSWAYAQVPSGCNGNTSTNSSCAGYLATFINEMYSYLYSGGTSYSGNQLGAAMIINTMLTNSSSGYQPGSGAKAGVVYAEQNFQKWQDLVTKYSNAGLVIWDKEEGYNSGEQDTTGLAYCRDGNLYDCSSNFDDVFFTLSTGFDANVIEFLNPSDPNGAPIYSINRLCGNIIGDVKPLGPTNIKADVSGKVYAYNGVEEEPVKNAKIRYESCNTSGAPTVSTDSSGNFTAAITGTTSYCIKIGNLPGNDTAYINPNGNGPPPDYNCDGYTDYYPDQTLGEPNCDNVEPNGYNIVIVSMATIHCSISGTPTNPSVGTSVNITLDITQVSWGSGNWVSGDPAFGNASATLDSNTYPLNTQGSPLTFKGQSGNLDTAGKFTLAGSVTASTYASGASCSSTVIAYYEPYFSVQGGDVFAGRSPLYVSACYNNNHSGDIYSWNQGSGNYYGAGTTDAAVATFNINQFVSGQDVYNPNSNPPTPSPYPLTFANIYKAGGADYPYGGNYQTTSSDCNMPTYLDVAKQTGTITSQGPGTLPAITLAAGDHLIYVVTSGNITINSNISYPSSFSVSNVSDIPTFELIDEDGNIIISNNVKTLVGTYIAENGVIEDSVQNSGSGPNEIDPIVCSGSSDNQKNTACNNDQLTVYGSFIANQIDLYRSYGSVNDANSYSDSYKYAAEQFYFSPLNWLIPSSNQGLTVQSITSLPPVL